MASNTKRRFVRKRPIEDDGPVRPKAGESSQVEGRVRLPQRLIGAVDKAAASMGMSRQQWVAALITHRLTGRPGFQRREELTLFQAHSELRRMLTELLMIRRALVDAGHPVSSSELLEALDNHAAMLKAAMAAIRDAVQGNLSYWRAPS